jgi:hypothetical protein
MWTTCFSLNFHSGEVEWSRHREDVLGRSLHITEVELGTHLQNGDPQEWRVKLCCDSLSEELRQGSKKKKQK